MTEVRKLWKHCIHPDLGSAVMFVGFGRPGFGALPPVAEQQARLCVQVLRGAVPLPSPEEMRLQVPASCVSLVFSCLLCEGVPAV